MWNLLQWSRKHLSVISFWGQNWHILPSLSCQVYLCAVQSLCAPSACALSLCLCCWWVVLLFLNCDNFRIQNLSSLPLSTMFFHSVFVCWARCTHVIEFWSGCMCRGMCCLCHFPHKLTPGINSAVPLPSLDHPSSLPAHFIFRYVVLTRNMKAKKKARKTMKNGQLRQFILV